MKKTDLVPLLALLLSLCAAALSAQTQGVRVLFVYDEVNDRSSPYIGYFKAALAAGGLAFDEANAAQVKTMDLSRYDLLLVHGMVMAFNTKSPVRDWLGAEKRLEGKKVALFVTANRWFLDRLSGQLSDALKKDKAAVVDAVSTATKDLDAAAKEAMVKSFVSRLP